MCNNLVHFDTIIVGGLVWTYELFLSCGCYGCDITCYLYNDIYLYVGMLGFILFHFDTIMDGGFGVMCVVVMHSYYKLFL